MSLAIPSDWSVRLQRFVKTAWLRDDKLVVTKDQLLVTMNMHCHI